MVIRLPIVSQNYKKVKSKQGGIDKTPVTNYELKTNVRIREFP